MRETWCLLQIHYGAPLLMRASVTACPLLSECRCARRRTVVAISIVSGHTSRRLRTFRARALHEGVRLMRVGRRGEKRGRDARVMGHACDPRRISSLYGIACSSRGTHDGSSASYVRSICCVVHAVQNIVCAEPIGHLHFHRR